MKIQSNIAIVTERIKEKLMLLSDREYLLRPVCFDVIDLMTKRIHIDGKASDDSQIGTYSKGYMALRTGNFQNSDKFSKGAQKGKNKNAGVFTKRGTRFFTQEDEETVTSKRRFVKTEFENKARPQYHRSSDPKVVISLTRQLENDWSVIATDKGYGIGFLNSFNLQKARWTEETYKKKIFNLTQSERAYAIKLIQELIRKAIQ